LLVSLALLPAGWADNPRQLLKDGTAAFENEDYAAAVEAFSEAGATAEDNGLDPAVALYNHSTALLKQERHEEAANGFSQALSTTDLDLQSMAYFNRGNAQMRMAENRQQANEIEPALQAVEQALQMYENAMALKPRDTAPKINYELALLKREQLQQLQQQQQQQQQDQQQDQQEQNQDQQNEDREEPQDQQQDQSSGPEEQEQEQQQQPQQQDQDEPSQGAEAEMQPQASEEMTPEEAMMLLEAMKEEEQADREKMRLRLGRPVPVEKDW
jgi:tetratricopeptide (TPR) repeat protein